MLHGKINIKPKTIDIFVGEHNTSSQNALLDYVGIKKKNVL